jgi:hypothetical protein
MNIVKQANSHITYIFYPHDFTRRSMQYYNIALGLHKVSLMKVNDRTNIINMHASSRRY